MTLPGSGMSVPSIATNACPARPAAVSAASSFGARAASKATAPWTYRQAVVVPAPNPAAGAAKASPVRRCTKTSSARSGSVRLTRSVQG
jgi:hypothetical protein